MSRAIKHHQTHQHMHNGSNRGRRETQKERKNIQKDNGWKQPKFNEKQYPTHPGSSVNSKNESMKTYYSKNAESQRQEENLKSSRRKTVCITCKGTLIRLTDNFSSERMRPEGRGEQIWSC